MTYAILGRRSHYLNSQVRSRAGWHTGSITNRFNSARLWARIKLRPSHVTGRFDEWFQASNARHRRWAV